MPFSDLPQELVWEILNHLDGRSLLQSCSSVCRLWKETIDSSAELQYRLELWADGMVVGDSGNSPAVEKLEVLYERRRAWLTLHWTSTTTIPIESSSRAYELVDGIFAQQNIGPGSFTTVSLPSTRDRIPRATSNCDLGMQPRDFVIDPTQDLVAFVYEHPSNVCNVDYRALSSLKPHPLAAIATMSFQASNFPMGYLSVELADDVVSLFFGYSGRIVLLNWREGTVIADIAGEYNYASPCSFSLLSPRVFILGHSIDSGKIEIWDFEGRASSTPNLAVSLQLPEVIEGATIEYVVAHSGPFRAAPAAGKPFSKSNESRLCVLSLEYPEDVYSLFVPHRYFHAQLSKRGEVIPWDDWGPQHSRMLPGMDHRWLRYVHGERVVLPRDPEDPNLIQILDFGMSASRPSVNPNSDSELRTDSSTIFDEGLFKDAVATHLPYRRIVRSVAEEHPILLIDEEQVIGVNDSESKMTVYAF
ncbi:hypothetical protein DFH09DRAFT_48254 [Mycena vulgaris]|nr:hypothetical protein DFH09DRAFT_48254 [Mycena vulgaris]